MKEKKVVVILVILMLIGMTLYALNKSTILQNTDVELTINDTIGDMSPADMNLWRSSGVYAAFEIESRYKSDETLIIKAYEYKTGKMTNEFDLATLYRDSKNANVVFNLDKEKGYRFVGGNGIYYDSGWFTPYTQSSYGMKLSSNDVSVNKGEEVLIGYFASSVENGLKMYNVVFGVDINTLDSECLDNDMVILITATVE